MKTFLLFIFIILSSFSYSQEDYQKLYSKVWLRTANSITPINGGNFGFISKEMISKIDTSIISSYMIQSFNEFRKDYGLPPVKEDLKMTKESIFYAEKLFVTYEHDKNLPKNTAENIANINSILLSKIDTNLYDINKVISECIFDIFVNSKAHMAMLLSKEYNYYGFGFFEKSGGFKVCVRGRK